MRGTNGHAEAVTGPADRERNRIERDLHDGAQQTLVALLVTLAELNDHCTGHPDPAVSILAGRSGDLAERALAELRSLVCGEGPAALRSDGLAAALDSLAAGASVPLALDTRIPRDLPVEIEGAAYFVCCEALTNAVKHARAGRVAIAVRRRGRHLKIVVADDGVGGADPTRGSGLAGLVGRVAALGGHLEVTSRRGEGTRLVARLPLPRARREPIGELRARPDVELAVGAAQMRLDGLGRHEERLGDSAVA